MLKKLYQNSKINLQFHFIFHPIHNNRHLLINKEMFHILILSIMVKLIINQIFSLVLSFFKKKKKNEKNEEKFLPVL